MIVAPLLNLSFAKRFSTSHADFRTGSGNPSTLPAWLGGNHLETLRKLCGM